MKIYLIFSISSHALDEHSKRKGTGQTRSRQLVLLEEFYGSLRSWASTEDKNTSINQTKLGAGSSTTIYLLLSKVTSRRELG